MVIKMNICIDRNNIRLRQPDSVTIVRLQWFACILRRTKLSRVGPERQSFGAVRFRCLGAVPKTALRTMQERATKH